MPRMYIGRSHRAWKRRRGPLSNRDAALRKVSPRNPAAGMRDGRGWRRGVRKGGGPEVRWGTWGSHEAMRRWAGWGSEGGGDRQDGEGWGWWGKLTDLNVPLQWGRSQCQWRAGTELPAAGRSGGPQCCGGKQYMWSGIRLRNSMVCVP